jgi:hypothetical protein
MRKARSWPLPWGLAFAAALAAQTPVPDASLRGPAIGEVRDAAGKPWTSAEVVLRSRPLPNDPDAGECDEVRATVDERGRFHAAVLRGRPYSAWAWAAPEANGRRASDVVELVFAQRAIVLQESRVLKRRRAVLAEAQRWPDAKFALRVVDLTQNRGVSWLDVGDGAATLPWLVGGEANVELFAMQGKVRVPLRRERLAADVGELRIEVPERRRATCWVRGAGTPCADCEVLYVLGDALFAAGRTDQGGKLELDVPVYERPHGAFRLFARCEGITVGLCSEIGLDPGGPAPDLSSGAKPGDWFTNVDSGSSVSLHILGGDGMPLGGVEVWAAGMATQAGRSSRAYDRWFGTVSTDANGDARVLGFTKQTHLVHLLLPERALATLPPAWRGGLAPVVFAPLVGATGTGTRETPYVVDPRRMCPLELRLTLPNGDPAALAEIALVVLQPYVGSPWSWNRDTLHADQVGCVRILVPGDVHLGIRAVHGESILIRGLATAGGHNDAGPAVVTLRLPPPTAIHGRLVDKTGAPLAGRLISPSFGTDNKAMEWLWSTEPSAAPATQNHAHVLLPDDEHERLMLTNLIARSVPTDADGRFVVPLPADPLPGLLLFQSTPDARSKFDALQVHWTGETQDDVVFTAKL